MTAARPPVRLRRYDVFLCGVRLALIASITIFSCFLTLPALAFPGLYASKDDKPRFSNLTHVVVFRRDGVNVVTVMPDYQGPLGNFAWLIPVPTDVVASEVRTLRRDIVDHLDQITAPRFAEFWEMDPCEPGPAEQEWERNLKVEGTGFLGDGMSTGEKKVAPELLLNLDPEFRDSTYVFSTIAAGEDVGAWLKTKGYQLPAAALEATKKYSEQQFLVVEVDGNKMEVAGLNRAILSPIRFVTKTAWKIPETLGLTQLKDRQELIVHVIDPERRFQVGNYGNVYPPTNVQVDFKVKERMPEFYGGLSDLVFAKNPKAFLVEYAWSSKGCGEPCATAPLSLAELLTFGADAFERTVPKSELLPKPPELTEEEKKAYKEAKRDEKKRLDEQRKELARRKALIGRNERYVLTRLRYQYDKAGVSQDVELVPAPHVSGGVALPKGESGEGAQEVVESAQSKLQTRFNSLHPNIAVLKCDAPERFRWGKAPRDYRGLRKIFLAQDMATKNHALFKPAEVVKTPIAALGLPGLVVKAPETAATGGQASGPVQPGAAEDAKKGGCRLAVGAVRADTAWWWAAAFAFVVMARARRTQLRGGRSAERT